MAAVDLVFDAGCPNVPAAREQLQAAFAQLGLEPAWRELVNGSDDVPEYARGYGSPTVLVDRRDVLGAEPQAASCCRVYRDDGGALVGVPPVRAIVDALRASEPSRGGRGGGGGEPPSGTWRTSLAVVPSLVLSVLPQVACPSCWPAYAGALGAMGLGFLMSTAYLLPITGVSLLVALGALGWRARSRRGYGPLLLGLLASAVLLVGKLASETDLAMVAGVGGLLAASIWNSWPRADRACPVEPATATSR